MASAGTPLGPPSPFGASESSCARLKMDELFVAWLGLKETGVMIQGMLDAIAAGKPIEKSSTTLLPSVASPNSSSQEMSPRAHRGNHGLLGYPQPPRSPNSKPSEKKAARLQRPFPERFVSTETTPEKDAHEGDEEEIKRKVSVGSSVEEGPVSPPDQPRRPAIPPFYVPGEGGRGRGRPIPGSKFEQRKEDIAALFKEHPRGIASEDFVMVTKALCSFPSYFNSVLFRRILELFGGADALASHEADEERLEPPRVSLPMFQAFWESEMEPYDTIERFFRLVKQPNADHIGKDDFNPFISDLLIFHPGLEFLDQHPDFHPKYAAMVIARIFYVVNTARNGRITLRELRKSNLVQMFTLVDEEEDINKVTQFFSYEHFYVLFCRFYELDTDRDNKLTRENIMKYADHALSDAIVARIFEEGPRPFEPSAEDGGREYMNYQDYVFFMLSEEDKGNVQSLKYWFACVDFDGDGKIGHLEMRYFYDIQLRRMVSLGHEVVTYEDMVCQIWDILRIDKPYVTLADLTRPEIIKVAGTFFDCLFNLTKFIGFEQRDPFSERQKRADMFESDWDRFAFHDYNRLAAEDERDGDGMDMDVAEEWINEGDDSGGMVVEAPF